jgi:hypothetical protein
LKHKIHFLHKIFIALGINFHTLFCAIKGIPIYFKNYFILKKQTKIYNKFLISSLYPILGEQFMESGIMKGHYFHQDVLVARKIFLSNPIKHIDIGSRTDGFVAHVAVYREIEIFDIRPQKSNVKNISFKEANLMLLDSTLKEYCDSVSALHSIEHFGLGRYGDPIDIQGHEKAINNIHQILKPNGIFYFSVPVGPQRIEYNAHRVFSLKYLFEFFNDKFELLSFSFVDDNGNLLENLNLSEVDIDTNLNCNYGCGIFELKKISLC